MVGRSTTGAVNMFACIWWVVDSESSADKLAFPADGRWVAEHHIDSALVNEESHS